MSFAWPFALVALAAIPILALLYAWLLRRRRKYAVQFASLSLIRDVIPRRSRWKRFAICISDLPLTNENASNARRSYQAHISLTQEEFFT